MATFTFRDTITHTNGDLPSIGSKAKDFSLVRRDLSTATLADYAGRRLVLNIFPSFDTSTCARSVRVFNEKAASLNDTVVICISHDLPFAQKRFCEAEGIENLEALSDFRGGKFGKDYGLEILDGKFEGLHARAIVVIDREGDIAYTELVPDLSSEPNYDAALFSLK